jgi:enoyl-CoA hydratase/carnithine racemase
MNTVRMEVDERGCATIWLDRPDKRNALDENLLTELADAVDRIHRHDGVRVVLLRSTSPVFSAGADLNEWASPTPQEAARLSLLGSTAFQALADLPMPVIAVLEGPAVGGGLELALACDIRLGTEACRVGFPEPRLANTPAWGGVSRLVEIAGVAAARDLLLTGEIVDASEAYRIGVLQRLCAESVLEERVQALVESVLACAPVALLTLKALLSSEERRRRTLESITAGFSATLEESRHRKEAFLAARQSRREG